MLTIIPVKRYYAHILYTYTTQYMHSTNNNICVLVLYIGASHNGYRPTFSRTTHQCGLDRAQRHLTGTITTTALIVSSYTIQYIMYLYTYTPYNTLLCM